MSIASDSPDFSGASLITGSQPAAGSPIVTVPTTVESIVSIVEAAGSWWLAGQSNVGLGAGSTASQNPPAATGTQVYALDYIGMMLVQTSAAYDLEGYLAVNNYKLVDIFSTTGSRQSLTLALNGLVIPNTATIVIAIHNASGGNTYTGMQMALIGRNVTP